NTILQSGNLITADSNKVNHRFVWTNNLAPHNKYGVTGNGTGTPTLETYFPGAVFRQNVLAGGRASSYPADNYFPANLNEVNFIDYAGRNYRLASNSLYKFLGTDGKDLGCDSEALSAALSVTERDYVSKETVTAAMGSPAVLTIDPSGAGEVGAGEAVALNEDNGRSGPFSVLTTAMAGGEHSTRLMLFTTGISGAAPNTNPNNDVRLGDRVLANLAESVGVEARTAEGRVIRLDVEYAGLQGKYSGLDQVNIIIPPELNGIDRIELTIIVGERRSNTGIISFKP
ncbi:MAG: hypothetical protein WKF30_19745, partial [Pyrinomonadaceae bacterium]